jgi:hypothetical protein
MWEARSDEKIFINKKYSLRLNFHLKRAFWEVFNVGGCLAVFRRF